MTFLLREVVGFWFFLHVCFSHRSETWTGRGAVRFVGCEQAGFVEGLAAAEAKWTAGALVLVDPAGR